MDLENLTYSLCNAIVKEDVKHVKELLERGAKWNDPIASPLLKFYQLDSEDTDEKIEMLKILLDAGVSLDEYDLKQRVIEKFLTFGQKRTVETVLQYKNDLSFKYEDAKGNTLLHYLAANVNPSIIEVLRGRKDINVNVFNDKGETPILIALEFCNFNTVKFLLENGADVNVSNEKGETTLLIAARSGNVDIVQNLLDRGAKVDSSIDPLQLIWPHFKDKTKEFCENNAAKIVELLLDHGANFQWLPDIDFINDCNISFVKPIIARLAIQELHEYSINPFLALKINSHRLLIHHFEVLKKELQELEDKMAYKSITYYDILIRSSENISLFVYEQEFIKSFHNLIYSSPDYYYKNMIHEKIMKAVPTANMREKSISIISKITGFHCNAYPHVVFRIASFLNYLDLENLCLADNKFIENNLEISFQIFGEKLLNV